MLRVAVPNKGSLSRPATELLGESGYRVHREHRALLATDRDNQVQLVFLRPGDIARNVGSGVLDLGITGQDLLHEVGTSASRPSCSNSASAARSSISPRRPASTT